MRSRIDPDRLAQIQTLSEGGHTSIDEGMCVMEAVAYVAGEPWSDAPQCACPVITRFMVGWNDGLPDNDARDRLLKPLIPMIVGTRSTPACESIRAWLARDWMIRELTPAWLDLVPATAEHAAQLRALAPITSEPQLAAAQLALDQARSAANAARDAARDALETTTKILQTSASALVRRMVEVTA